MKNFKSLAFGVVLGLLVIGTLGFASDHTNDIPFLPFWLKTCPSTGSGSAHCLITVPDGKALVFEYTGSNNGAGIGVYGEKGYMARDNPLGGIEYAGPGTYEIDVDNAEWAIVPIEWARQLAN